jgi:tungstate transport system ATP-binding protein
MLNEQSAHVRLRQPLRSEPQRFDPLPYRLEHVTRRYGKQLVLDIPALDVPHGEVLVLVGPSGAGKSTLLRLLNFLEPPNSGTIWFQGTPVRSDGLAPLELRRQVTTVFQRPTLLSTSVINNVAYGLQIRKATQVRSLAGEALEQVGLSHLANTPARTLSGGEMQRVALARAIVLAPRVLLLDEPTANLDPYNVQLIERVIATLHQQYATTIVLVTHNVFQARRLAQRVALMLAGQIVEIADTTAFFDAPRDARTAAFVRGEMVC